MEPKTCDGTGLFPHERKRERIAVPFRYHCTVADCGNKSDAPNVL
jgi:hypothetical protein